MPPRAEPRATSTSLLTIRTGHRRWGLPGSSVTGVELFERDKHRLTLDALELLDGVTTVREDDSTRVLQLLVDGQQVSLLTCGTLTLLDSSAYELLALPHELGGVAPLVSHIALIDGKPSLFVLSPERLLALHRELHAAVTPPSDRASSC